MNREYRSRIAARYSLRSRHDELGGVADPALIRRAGRKLAVEHIRRDRLVGSLIVVSLNRFGACALDLSPCISRMTRFSLTRSPL